MAGSKRATAWAAVHAGQMGQNEWQEPRLDIGRDEHQACRKHDDANDTQDC